MNDQQLFAELMRSQMLTPLQLQDLQRRHLAAMVNFAYRAVPFYRTRLAPVIGSGGFDPRRWLEVPTIDRPAVQQHVAELTPASVPSHAGLSSEKSTSGSAGRVLHLKRSALSSQFDIALTQRAYTWWRLDPRATQAVILTLNDDDPILRTEGQRAWHLSDPAGRVFALQASVPPADQVQFMRERAADYLVSQPSMAAAVAESVLRSGRPLKLQAVLTLGESLHPEQRDLFRHAFGGARAFDTYGCIEAGHMAAECPVCGWYHVNAETVLVEILDDRGQPVGPGETGRAVLTSLHNYAMPLIRYDIGDYITRAPRGNRCKRGLPSIAAIVGRETELFVTRDGEQYFPSMQARQVADYIDLTEIQFVQTDYELVEIRYVPGQSGIPNRAGELLPLVEAKLGHGIKVKLVPVAELPRPRGAKQIMKLSLVPRPPRS